LKKIVLVVKGEISVSPTVINYLTAFLSLGFEVHCICSSASLNDKLKTVNFHEVGSDHNSNPIKKIINYYTFGVKVRSKLLELDLTENDFFWVSRVDTALSLININLEKYNSVLALHELHDGHNIWMKITKAVVQKYNVIVYNEANRAQIGRVWFNLDELPEVIPNKPFEHPRKKKIEIIDSALSKLFESFAGKKLIIYQGSLELDRDIEPLVRASTKFSEEFKLLIMGRDPHNRIEHLKRINPELHYISWVVPPDHLNITSFAYIGVAFYDTDCLNSIYCAPNKIWEYSGFNIPVLGQNIPGLLNSIATNKFGLCVDIGKEEMIYDAIKKIDENYEQYSVNAGEFYESVNFESLVKAALNKTVINNRIK